MGMDFALVSSFHGKPEWLLEGKPAARFVSAYLPHA